MQRALLLRSCLGRKIHDDRRSLRTVMVDCGAEGRSRSIPAGSLGGLVL